ncbi:BrnA antitoxin family protein [Methylobacterium sp. 77]|uniref:BrnA antitoxin family protein n=1 Tax=Methylobacterium sp. 77 TaxID=1101192 RepID=UPI0003665235|nr:BrnA antitoxin family protein [Methylobacterium sp. 77]
MPKIDPTVPEITDEDEARIQRGIAADPDNPEITPSEFARMRPMADAMPPALYEALTKAGRGRPKSGGAKVLLTLRIDPHVVDAYKATGTGWQTRMNDALARSVKDLPR